MTTMTQTRDLSPLDLILLDIERALAARLYYPALAVALTIPEICSALTMDNREFVRERNYVAFVDGYTTPSELGLSGIECYRLRGGVIHRANASGHPLFGSTHVIFTIPETGIQLHAFSLVNGDKSSAVFDLPMFCSAMAQAARRWFEDHRNDSKVFENMPNLLSFRPNGMPPFMGGAPVVASGPQS